MKFTERKDKGFYVEAVATVATLLGLIFFLVLSSVSPEESENPVLIVILSFAAILLTLIVCFKDYYKIFSVAAFVLEAVTFFNVIAGRVSYLAFYFSGDAMNTGLSVFFILAFLCYLIALVSSLLGVLFKQEKNDRVGFDKKDGKVLATIVLSVAIVCTGTALAKANVFGGNPSDDPVVDRTDDPILPEEKYKSPSKSEEVWQEYTAEQYLAEDVSQKGIAYQLTGEAEIKAAKAEKFVALVNLYEDGLSVATVYGMGRVSTYYGYWTNEEDHLWFCVAHYTMESQEGSCTIDYSYELTGDFDEVTFNVALGFANGGQFIREMPIGGDGSIVHQTVDDFLAAQGYSKYKSPSKAEEEWQEYTAEKYLAEDVSQKGIVYQLTGEAEINAAKAEKFVALVNLYEDGLSVATVYGMGRVSTYYGYWTNEEDHLWFCVAHYTMESQEGSCTIDYSYELTGKFDEVTFNVALGFANGGQFIREMPIGGDGAIEYKTVNEFLKANGKEIADTPDVPDEPVVSEVLFSFLSDSENYLLDINKDGTYTFTFKTAGLVEKGTWTWKGWTFTLVDANGKETVMKPDDAHKLSFTFRSVAANGAVTRDFSCEASVWGTAFDGKGDYTTE